VQGKALLETNEISSQRALVSKSPSRNQINQGDRWELRVQSPDGAIVFEIGPYAEKWAHKILHPKSRIEKLGIKPDAKVTVIGNWIRNLKGNLKKYHRTSRAEPSRLTRNAFF